MILQQSLLGDACTYEKGKGCGVGHYNRSERDGEELGICGVGARGRGWCAALVEDVDLIGGGVVDNLIRDESTV